MTNRKRRPGRRDPDEWTWRNTGGGIVLGVVAVSLIATMLILRQMVPAPSDPNTMCPDTDPPAVTAILIDTTDRVGTISLDDIRGRLDKIVKDSKPDDMMLVYKSAPIASAGDEPEPLSSSSSTSANRRLSGWPPSLTVCNPGDEKAVKNQTLISRLMLTQAQMRRRFENRFQARLGREFETLLSQDAAKVSPLMENVQAIAINVRQYDTDTHTPRAILRGETKRFRKHLVLVSDLMQNVQNDNVLDVSFYPQPPDYDRFAASHGATALRTNLTGVSVKVLFIQRQRTLGNSLRLVEFWNRWITDQGGQFMGASKIAGVN